MVPKSYPSRSKAYHGTLIYSEQINLNPGVTGIAQYVFASNGLYDPDITGAGHQPAGFDQLMGLWNEYVVVASEIKVSFTNASTDAVGVTCGISHVDSATTSGDFRVYIENGQTVWGKIATRAGMDKITLTNNVNIRDISTQDIFNDDNFSGTSAKNPNDTHYWHIWVYADQGTDIGSVYATVEITYDSYFRDPSLQALS